MKRSVHVDNLIDYSLVWQTEWTLSRRGGSPCAVGVLWTCCGCQGSLIRPTHPQGVCRPSATLHRVVGRGLGRGANLLCQHPEIPVG